MPGSRKKEWLLLQKQNNISAYKIFNILVKSGNKAFPLFLYLYFILSTSIEFKQVFVSRYVKPDKKRLFPGLLTKISAMAG